MRLLFAGTPDAAVPALDVLAAGPHEIVRVLTRPPAPQGRRRVLTPSPVEARAVELGLPVLRAARLDEAATATLLADHADLGVVVAYGALIKEPLLSAPREGWVNLHFSLLPRWRGAAPVQHALLAGDRVTGVAVFRLEAGLDTGPLLAMEEVPIGALETAGHLLPRLAGIGAAVLARTVDAIAAGTAGAVPQEGEPTFAGKLALEDGRLDLTASAAAVLDRYRGTTPEPGAFTEVAGARLKVLEAAPARDAARLAPGEVAAVGRRVLVGTGDDPVELVTVQPAGRTAMPAAAWLHGAAKPVRLG
ncbi:MAG: methionyl-tRNA formyltransferase [Amnibacterium sp.]